MLAIGFDVNATVGRSIYDQKGNTELTAMLEAFQTACAGSVYIGNTPSIQGATFTGPVSLTMGGSTWSGVSFNSCIFKDGTGISQVLNLTTDCGGNMSFSNCVFSGSAAGL